MDDGVTQDADELVSVDLVLILVLLVSPFFAYPLGQILPDHEHGRGEDGRPVVLPEGVFLSCW